MVVVGAVVVDPAAGSVVLEPVVAVVVVVELFAAGVPLPQAANMSPAAAMASTTVPDVRTNRLRS
jgi:hypothetical protein